MPGSFDGIFTGLKGSLVNHKQIEIVGNNIANAANEDYTRQEARLVSQGSIFEGGLPFGQGVEITKVLRVRDELLDRQLRSTQSSESDFKAQLKWLQRIESIYNEPSENGINNALSTFWESWSELSNDPENFATRSNIISQAENISQLIRSLDTKLANFDQELTLELRQSIDEINAGAYEIAELNKEIFRLELGENNEANDLRDQRDGAVKELSEKIRFTAKEESNGMVNILVGQHPLVYQDRNENLITRTDPLDASKTQVIWEHGDNIFVPEGGGISGILQVRDNVIPSSRSDLDSFVDFLIKEVNNIYANGVSLDAKTLMESRLGYEALGVTNSTTSLSLVPSGKYGSMHVSFYDSSGDVIRSSGIVVDSDDSLDDIVQKLNEIRGLNVSAVSSETNDGRIRFELDTVSGLNDLEEVSFAISDNTQGFDSTGFLNLLNFDQTEKSTNASSVAPTLTSRDLSELQTILGENSVADVMSKALNFSGSFTINSFETGTEDVGKTNGYHVQQLVIDVVSTDSINSIMTKINNLTANYGVSISLDASNQIVLTTTARTDSEGNLSTTTGTNFVRLSFANTYQFPQVTSDEPPDLYNAKGDNTQMLAKMQFNTLFQGSKASDIALDSYITSADKINAGYKLANGDNELSLDMVSLQNEKVALDNQFTIGEYYQNLVSEFGTNVVKAENLANNENLVLQSFLNEKDQISGVNLDEELANMIVFQRSYEANARMIKTFSEMLQEILQIG